MCQASEAMQFERDYDNKKAKYCGPYYSLSKGETRERQAIKEEWNEMSEKHALHIPKGAYFVVGVAGPQEEKGKTLPGGGWQVYFNIQQGSNELINLQYKDTKKKDMDKHVNDFYRKNHQWLLDHTEGVLKTKEK